MKASYSVGRAVLGLTLTLVTACGADAPNAPETPEAPDEQKLLAGPKPAFTREEPKDVGETRQALGTVHFAGSCSNQQKSELQTFHVWLSGYVSDAFWNWSSYPNRRAAAFGNMTPQQSSRVFYDLDDMDYWLENDDFTYSCETDGLCSNGSTGAWVYQNHIDNTIHVCPVFWAQDNQMRLFILSHELAHFAGAHDYGYDGYDDFTAALIFAAYAPDIAVDNANNYAFYVMNPYGWPN